MEARSVAESTPTANSIRACASEPAISTAASRRSKSTDAVNRFTRSATGSAKRPDQPREAASGGGLDGAMAVARFPARKGTKKRRMLRSGVAERRCFLASPPAHADNEPRLAELADPRPQIAGTKLASGVR